MVRRLLERVGASRLAAAQELAGVRGDALDLLGVPRQERVVVDDFDLRLEQGVPEVGRDQIALAVVVVLALGCSTPRRSRIVMPGVTMRKRFAKRASLGAITLLIVCQAMSIAITTVLPAPVAIFRPTRGSPSLWAAFSGSSRRR